MIQVFLGSSRSRRVPVQRERPKWRKKVPQKAGVHRTMAAATPKTSIRTTEAPLPAFPALSRATRATPTHPPSRTAFHQSLLPPLLCWLTHRSPRLSPLSLSLLSHRKACPPLILLRAPLLPLQIPPNLPLASQLPRRAQTTEHSPPLTLFLVHLLYHQQWDRILLFLLHFRSHPLSTLRSRMVSHL